VIGFYGELQNYKWFLAVSPSMLVVHWISFIFAGKVAIFENPKE